MLYPEKNYIDKGKIIQESHKLNDPLDSGYYIEPGFKAIKLAYKARGKSILPDGTELPSSISVSANGIPFGEVFSFPIPSGNYFFHKDIPNTEDSILLFNTNHPDGLTLLISYETKGTKLKARAFNIFNYGKNTFSSEGTIVLTHKYPENIQDVVVLCSAADGSQVTYEVDINNGVATITLSGSSGVECSYFLIAIPE